MSSMYPPTGGQIVYCCARCGLPLLPDVPVCRNCGWYNALPPPSFANDAYAAPAQNQQPIANNGYGMPGQIQQPGYNAFANAQPGMYYAPPTAAANMYQPAVNGFAPGDYYQPQQLKRGPNIGLIALVVILVLIVIGGGSIAGYFFLIKNTNQGNATTTSTVAITTPSVKPLFSDSFANNATGWDLTSSPGNYSVSVGGSQMLLEDDNNKLLWDILPGQTFADFRLDVDAKLTKGDPGNGYGVFIRGTATQSTDIGLY